MAHVLDTSALMSLLLDEPSAGTVQAILEGEEPVFLPFIALMELRYVLLRQFPIERVEEIIETLRATQAEIVESGPEWGRVAADIKAGGGLSLADAWMAALALIKDAALVHKDPEFDGVQDLKAVPLR